jgi:hypothetical protein
VREGGRAALGADADGRTRVVPFASCFLQRATIATQQQRGFKVAVLGAAGGIGQPLSLLLKLNPKVTELSCFDLAPVTPGNGRLASARFLRVRGGGRGPDEASDAAGHALRRVPRRGGRCPCADPLRLPKCAGRASRSHLPSFLLRLTGREIKHRCGC